MLTERDIRLFCSQRVFPRAQEIARSRSRFLDKRAHREGGEIVLSAECRGSSRGDAYDVELVLDDSGEVADFSCTCPAAYNWSGMCKHCAALGLSYLEDPGSFAEGGSPAARRTSSRVMDLMQHAEAAAAQDDGGAGGPVELVPTLSYGYGDWSVRFKIAGPSGSYVLKGISDFLAHMRSGETFSYGKRLSFPHVPEALSERSRKLAGFLERAEEARRQSSEWRMRRMGGDIERDLALSSGELVELLDILDGAAFDVQGSDAGTRALTHARVDGGEPRLDIVFIPAEGGYSIEVAQRAVLIRSGARMYLWEDDAFRRCPAAWAGCADLLELLFDREAEPPFIASGDLPLFCATLLPRMEKALGVAAPPELEALKPAPCDLRFYFDREGAEIVCEARAAYDAAEFCVGTEAGPEAFGQGAGAGGAGAALPGGGAEVDGAAGVRRGGGVAGALRGGAVPALPGHAAGATLPGNAPLQDARAPQLRPLRDARREAKAEALVGRYFGEGWLPGAARLPLDDEAKAGELLYGGLAEFRKLGEVHVTPAFERLLRDKAPVVSFGVSLAGDLLNLTVSADDLPPAELAALLSSYRKRKRYHRLRDGAYIDLAECELAQLDRMARDLGVSQADLATGTVELPSFRAFYLDEESDLQRDRSFTRYLERFRAVSEERYAVPPSLEGVLRPYQAEGFRWLSARCDAGLGGILADEMGLGKSLQVIALLVARRGGTDAADGTAGATEAAETVETVGAAGASEPEKAEDARQASPSREERPDLIVCPASLVYNWLAEIDRFAPGLRACAIAGTKREREGLMARAFTDEHPYDVLVTSYDTLRIDVEAFSARRFGCCVLDEAHYIKNPATRVTRAVKRVKAQHRFALTGTPMENRLSDLWSIFDFLMPGILGPYTRFKERFELPIAGGDEDAAARLRRLIGPFMLRRRKQDVLADLPEKLESTVHVALEGEQKRLYDACEQQLRERLSEQKRVKGGRGKAAAATPEARNAAATAAAAGDDFAKRKVEILAELTKLRQICCDPALLYEDYKGPATKLQAIADLVASAREGGEKVLVFSQFTEFLAQIAQQLDLQGIAHYAITGATPKKRRVELVDAFNADDTPAFLISLKAGGTGLNLVGASVVIHADPWWNAAAQNQATDRAHRIGQARAVTVQKVIAKGTIEERIQRLQQAKAELADQVIGASGTSLAGLTREDLLELLG